MSSGPRGRRSSSRRPGDAAHGEDDSELLYRISNLDLAAQRARTGWEELLRLGGFTGRPGPEQYEQLFEFLLRAVVYPHGYRQFFLPGSWGLDRIVELSRDEWLNWYGRLHEAFDAGKHTELNSTTLRENWQSQLETIRFLAINYWNHLILRPSDKIFAGWLPVEIGQAEKGEGSLSPSTTAARRDWNRVRQQYKILTDLAGVRHRPYYTANRYLFDQAVRKRTVEWRFEPRRTLVPLDLSNVLSAFQAPVLTDAVKRALCVRSPKDVLSSEMSEVSFSKYIEEVETCFAAVWSPAADHLSRIKVALGKLPKDLKVKRLQRLVHEIELLHYNLKPINTPDLHSDDTLAGYLVQLSLYLNEVLCCPEDPDGDTGADWTEHLLGLNQCIFMARSLYEYYGGEIIPTASGQGGAHSFFYSIPVFVPTAKDGNSTAKTSILGIGTAERLRQSERRGWSRISEQLILPAQQQDVMIDERMRDAYDHIDAVIHAWRWDLRSSYKVLVELESDVVEGRRPKGRLLTDATCAISAGLRRSELLREALRTYYDPSAERHQLRCQGFKRHITEPDYSKAWFPMRLITLESLLRGLSSNRCGWVVKTRDLLHLTDKDVKAELERTAPTTRWQVNLVGFENIYVNTSMSCDPAAAWTLLFEEWASNVRHHRPSLPPQQPVAKITITRVPDGLSCNLEFGPFPGNSAQADARLSGHGSTLIRFCVDVLTPGGRLLHGFEKMRDGTCAWRLHFTIPEDRWEELCR